MSRFPHLCRFQCRRQVVGCRQQFTPQSQPLRRNVQGKRHFASAFDKPSESPAKNRVEFHVRSSVQDGRTVYKVPGIAVLTPGRAPSKKDPQAPAGLPMPSAPAVRQRGRRGTDSGEQVGAKCPSEQEQRNRNRVYTTYTLVPFLSSDRNSTGTVPAVPLVPLTVCMVENPRMFACLL